MPTIRTGHGSGTSATFRSEWACNRTALHTDVLCAPACVSRYTSYFRPVTIVWPYARREVWWNKTCVPLATDITLHLACSSVILRFAEKMYIWKLSLRKYSSSKVTITYKEGGWAERSLFSVVEWYFSVREISRIIKIIDYYLDHHVLSQHEICVHMFYVESINVRIWEDQNNRNVQSWVRVHRHRYFCYKSCTNSQIIIIINYSFAISHSHKKQQTVFSYLDALSSTL